MMLGSNKQAPQDITVIVEDELLQKLKSNDLVGAIDQGTSSTRFLVFTPKGDIAAWSQMEHTQFFPQGEDKVSLERSREKLVLIG
jgi:hypothetical protein